MGCYTIKTVQNLPIDIDTAWNFFSTPDNLKHITPEYMHFEVLDNSNSTKMFEGQIITYYVRPVLGIKLFWMTEITHMVKNQHFVDEQRIGPYKLWHHKHIFKTIPGGVEMTDIIHYQLPLGILGRLAHILFVNKQLQDIFAYRRKVLKEYFGELK